MHIANGFLQLLVLVCFFVVQIFAKDNFNGFSHFYIPDGEAEIRYEKPKQIYEKSANNITLTCNVTSCQYHKHRVEWKFKACQPNFEGMPCSYHYHFNNTAHTEGYSTWKTLSNRVIARNCKSNLKLQNSAKNQSGLYRCIYNNRVIEAYEVNIYSTSNDQPPKLLNVIPSNVTVAHNMQLVIQCKVYTKHQPVIWWFKQTDKFHYDIHYSNNFYNRINTSSQSYAVPQEVDIYLSKLHIRRVEEDSSGVYICVAMTALGTDYKEATVYVLPKSVPWNQRSSFFLLFLIPAILALIPITVWLCYFRKKKGENIILHCQQRSLIRPNVYPAALMRRTII